MKRCVNCKNCWFNSYLERYACSLNGQHIPHPYFMGGRCECWEPLHKIKFEYPRKEK